MRLGIGVRVEFVSGARYRRAGRGKIVDKKTGRTGVWFAVQADDDGRVVSVRAACLKEVRRAR